MESATVTVGRPANDETPEEPPYRPQTGEGLATASDYSFQLNADFLTA